MSLFLKFIWQLNPLKSNTFQRAQTENQLPCFCFAAATVASPFPGGGEQSSQEYVIHH